MINTENKFFRIFLELNKREGIKIQIFKTATLTQLKLNSKKRQDHSFLANTVPRGTIIW